MFQLRNDLLHAEEIYQVAKLDYLSKEKMMSKLK
jgi:hypothetical protein